MNSLTIDIGNSGVKADVWDDKGFILRIPDLNLDNLQQTADKYLLKGIVISSVRRESDKLIERIKQQTNCLIVDFNEAEYRKYYDLECYKGHLGADRVAAYLGAETLAPDRAKLIVDAGTAITLDVVDKHGKFRGGNITLGYQGRLKALAEATSLLPKVDGNGDTECFGTSTVSAITCGVRNAVLGEVIYSFRLARDLYEADCLVITGGDSKRIRPLKDEDIYVLEDPYLVGRGLDFHLRKNYLSDSGNHPIL